MTNTTFDIINQILLSLNFTFCYLHIFIKKKKKKKKLIEELFYFNIKQYWINRKYLLNHSQRLDKINKWKILKWKLSVFIWIYLWEFILLNCFFNKIPIHSYLQNSYNLMISSKLLHYFYFLEFPCLLLHFLFSLN